jgi:hypothetical protein
MQPGDQNADEGAPGEFPAHRRGREVGVEGAQEDREAFPVVVAAEIAKSGGRGGELVQQRFGAGESGGS